MKVGLIGLGGMGFVHFNCYKKMQDVEIVVADVRVDMAKEKIADEAIKVYPNLTELLANEDVDFVDICTPSYLHADLTVEALDAGKHVLCEKPMSITVAETQRMIDASVKNGKLLMTAHVVRFMAPYVYLKSVIDSGELGKPVHITMSRISSAPKWSWENWMLDLKKSGGTAIDLSIHDIDYIQNVFGKPVSYSATYRELEERDNYIVSTLNYNGFSVHITGGWYNTDLPFQASYLAVFENGYVQLKDGKVYKNGAEVSLDLGETSENTGINLSGADGYSDEIAYFISCINSGKKPERVTPESSQYSVGLVNELLSVAKRV